MTDDRKKAARSIQQFANHLITLGKSLRRLGPNDLSDENLFVVRGSIDELRSAVNEVGASLDVTSIN